VDYYKTSKIIDGGGKMADRAKSIAVILLFFLFFHSVGFKNDITYGDDVKTLENVAISLIIDKSGSMIDTDPNLMRETSANILIDLLSPEDYLGIISFSAEAEELHPMSGVGETGKDALKSKVAGNLAALGDTDYLKAFDLAFRQMESIEDDNINKVIIFLTDGDPDPDTTRRDEPGFMEGYMDSFWLKIKEIGLAGYTVHTVGLGTLNSEVMDRLALETTGTSNEYSEPSDVAVAFFNIISQLKNRNEFMNLSEEVAGEKLIDFTMNEFVSQETFVIRNMNGPIDVNFIPPEGVDLNQTLKMVKTENYTLTTINQKESESTGSWKMKIRGNATVEILGTRDLFVKIWINSPINNSLHPIGEPLEIRATLTGTSSEDLVVEGSVLIDGVEALQPLSFVKDGEDYIAIFDETQTRGNYEISLHVRLEEEIIAETNSSVSVKLLPAIKTDLVLSEIGYVQGESRIISSTLTLASNNLKISDELTLDYYELVQRNENDEETVVSLVDDGVFENGDVKAEDGIFSGVLSFDELGDKEIIIRARGTYNGDVFILERNLGRTKVLPPGVVNITSESSSFKLVKGEAAKLVLTLKSTSPYREVIGISIDQKYGALSSDAIVLDPMEEKTVTLTLTTSIEADGQPVTVPMVFSISNELTSLTRSDMNLEIIVTTNMARILNQIRDNLMMILIIILVVAAVFILIYGVGRMLYEKNFKKLYHVTGKLSFNGINDGFPALESGEIDLSSFRKSKILLTFSSERKDLVDYYIPGSRYDYDLIFEKQVEKSRFKFIDGYKSLSSKSSPKVLIRTTEPGILMIDGIILVKYEVTNQVDFTSGEYAFSYESAWEGNVQEDTGKNILEGKY